jgi:hypothetical protein
MDAMKSLIITIVVLVLAFPTAAHSKMTKLLCPLSSGPEIPVEFDPDRNFVHAADAIKAEISDDAIQFEMWHIIFQGDTRTNPSRSTTVIDRETRKFRMTIFDRHGKQMKVITGVCRLN